ncbi:MAG: alpha/beta fold hydrolase [bacterium]
MTPTQAAHRPRTGRSRGSSAPWMRAVACKAIAFLALGALLLAGCTAGYETRTKAGERIKEWFLPLKGGKVEALALWPAKEGPHPALLLIHAGQGSAQRFRGAMFDLVRKDLVVMSISLPGFGGSTGPEDFAGPRSVEAVLRAAEYLAEGGGVRPGAIAVYGIGQGAAAALLAAARSPHIRLAAVEGGVYDLEKAYAGLPPGRRVRLRQILGGGPGEVPEAYRIRSPIGRAGKLPSPLLILHARRSRFFPHSQAEALAEALRRAGGEARLITTGRNQESDPKAKSLKRWVLPFLRKQLKF